MNAWTVQGKYYGFPKCCVEAFENGEHILSGKELKLNGTGYIPCQHCNDTKTEDELVDSINLNRIEPKPFPHETGYDFSVQYMLDSDLFTSEEKALIQEQLDHNVECGLSENSESEEEFKYNQQISYLNLELEVILAVVNEFKSEVAYSKVHDRIYEFLVKQFLINDMSDESLQKFKDFNQSIKKEFKIIRIVNQLMQPHKNLQENSALFYCS